VHLALCHKQFHIAMELPFTLVSAAGNAKDLLHLPGTTADSRLAAVQ
jgi:hypothetical protein